MAKKTMYFLVSTLLVLTFLSACGGGGATSGQQHVDLSYVSWMTKGEDKPTLAAFMKQYPYITVHDEELNGTNYDQLLRPRFAGGNAPDVFLYMYSQFAPYVQQHWLMDVTNQPGTQAMMGNAGLVNAYTVNGKMYGALVNANYGDAPIYYNTKVFSKLGITPPTTMNDFLADCAKIKASGIDAIVLGGKDAWPVGYFVGGYQTAQQGATYGADANVNLQLAQGQTTIQDAYAPSLNFFANLVQQGYVAKASQTLTYDQSVQYFVDGKAALLPQGPWVPGLDAVKQADPSTFALGAFAMPLPTYQGKVVTTAGPDRSIGISASTKHPKEAELLYNFFLQKDNLQNYLQTQSLFTVTPNINPQVAPVLQPFVAAHQNTSQYDVLFNGVPPTGNYKQVTIPSGFSTATSNAYVDIMAGSTPQKELQLIQNAFNQVKSQITISG